MIKIPTTILVAFALLGATAAAKADAYVVTLTEATGAASCDGASTCVVATGGGAIDTTGLGLSAEDLVSSNVDPSESTIFTGSSALAYAYDHISSFTGPGNFGTGGTTFASSGTGDIVGINGSGDEVVVPLDYSSDTSLSDTAIYENATFASLGLTPGTYTWTWGGGCSTDQCFTIDVVSTPGPIAGAGLPGLIFAGGGLIAWWRRKRTVQAVA
jgi:hypothetical protein